MPIAIKQTAELRFSDITVLATCLMMPTGPALALQETKLYNTGPNEISGYVRFVNAASNPVSISTGASATLDLGVMDDQRIGRYQAVPARQKLAARVNAGNKSSNVEITVDPDEFVTLVVLPDGTIMALRDQPQAFNALKADIAFYNADPGCAEGIMKAGEKKTVVFFGVAPGMLARRSVNPVTAVIEAACGDESAGIPLDLGTLNAGGRYSVIVIPDNAGGHRLIGAEDQRAQY